MQKQAVRMESYKKVLDFWEAVEDDYDVSPLHDSPTVAQIFTVFTQTCVPNILFSFISSF